MITKRGGGGGGEGGGAEKIQKCLQNLYGFRDMQNILVLCSLIDSLNTNQKSTSYLA